MVTGQGPIVMRVENGYNFFEHGTVTDATKEAHRLCNDVGGTFVVFVPVKVVKLAPRTVERTLQVKV